MTHLRKRPKYENYYGFGFIHASSRMPVDIRNNLHIREHFVCTSVFHRLRSDAIRGPDGRKMTQRHTHLMQPE